MASAAGHRAGPRNLASSRAGWVVLCLIFAATLLADSGSSAESSAGPTAADSLPHWVLGSSSFAEEKPVSAWLVIPALDAGGMEVDVRVYGPSDVSSCIRGEDGECQSVSLQNGRPLSWHGHVSGDTTLALLVWSADGHGARLLSDVHRSSGTSRNSRTTVASEFINSKPGLDLPPVPMAIFSMLVGLVGGVAIQIVQRLLDERTRRKNEREGVELSIVKALSTELLGHERMLHDYLELIDRKGRPAPGQEAPTLLQNGLNQVLGVPSAVSFLERHDDYFPRLQKLIDEMDRYNRLVSAREEWNDPEVIDAARSVQSALSPLVHSLRG